MARATTTAGLQRPLRTMRSRHFAWGFVDQGFSSATNFGLSLVAGRLLGPAGLGAVFVGFSSYLVALGLQRALLTEPLVASSTLLPSDARDRATHRSLVVSLLGAVAAASALALAGLALGGRLGHVLILFAPWLVPVLVQDFWRAILFRDGRSAAAAANDGAWLVVMAAAAPLAWVVDAEWAVIGCWGLGGLAGMLLGFAQTRSAPSSPRRALAWWRSELWPFGRWLGANSLGYAVASYATVFVLVGIIGTARLGGLQAVITVFAPLSFIGAAIALPGLPAVAHALAESPAAARRLSVGIGLGATAITALYVGVLSLGGSSILRVVYGRSFSHFAHLVWPVGAGQLFAALAIGFTLLLKARKSGRSVLASGLVGSAASLGLTAGLASAYGLTGAAWGLSGGAGVSAAAAGVLALRR